MKLAFAAAALIALAPGDSAWAETVQVDLASFELSPGWQRMDMPNGLVQFRKLQVGGDPFASCALFVHASSRGSTDPALNFATVWPMVMTAIGVISLAPPPLIQPQADGTILAAGNVSVPMGVQVVTTTVVVATRQDVVMPLVLQGGPACAPEVMAIAGSLSLGGGARSPTPAPVGPGASARAPASPAAPDRGPVGDLSSLDDYAYALPGGWTSTRHSDGVALRSAVFNTGEQCQISMLPMRSASGDLAADARRAYLEVFKVDAFQNNASPYATASLTRGTSTEGWEFFIIRKPQGGYALEETTGTTLLVAGLGRKLAVIAAVGKRPLVSMCFGEAVRDEWPSFFANLRFRNWSSGSGNPELSRQLVGSWIGSHTVLQYNFLPNGRYATAGAMRPDVGTKGDGSYSLRGGSLTLTPDDGGSERHRVRLEQTSKDSGATWLERLCLVSESTGGEICYLRQ